MKKKLIVILGMHRGGTSLITRSLSVLGAEYGNNLMQSTQDNEKGYWEDNDIAALNEKILSGSRMHWHSAEPLPMRDCEKLATLGYNKIGLELLRQKISPYDTLTIKDPRITKLLAFWAEIFETLDAEIFYVIALRNPLSVAASLSNREKSRKDSWSMESNYQACLLWIDHMLQILKYLKNKSIVIIEYEKMMKCPTAELKKLKELTDLEIDQIKLNDFTNNFIANNLQHVNYTNEDLMNSFSIPNLCKEIYTFMKTRHIDGTSLALKENIELINKWEQDFMRLIPVYKELYRQTKEQYMLKNDQNSVYSEFEEIRKQVAEANKQAAEANKQAAEANKQAAEAKALAEMLKNSLDDIQTSSIWRLRRKVKTFLKVTKKVFERCKLN